MVGLAQMAFAGDVAWCVFVGVGTNVAGALNSSVLATRGVVEHGLTASAC